MGNPVEPKYLLALKHARATAVCVLFQFIGLLECADRSFGGGGGALHDFSRSVSCESHSAASKLEFCIRTDCKKFQCWTWTYKSGAVDLLTEIRHSKEC